MDFFVLGKRLTTDIKEKDFICRGMEIRSVYYMAYLNRSSNG